MAFRHHALIPSNHAARSTATLITAFAVPPDADEAFLAGWDRRRRSRGRLATTALHRALRADVDFRFVEIATGDLPAARREAGRRTLPFVAHSGVYEVVRDHGDVEGDGGALGIMPFDVAADEERFLSGWDRALGALAAQQGFIGTRLHRSLGSTERRFVSVTRWSSPLMVARAMRRPELRPADAMPSASPPALYAVARR